MNSFIRQRVVKSYAVEVSGPCMVDGQSGFQSLMEHLTLLTQVQEAPAAPEAHGEENTEVWSTLAREEGQRDRIMTEARCEAEEILGQARFRAEELVEAAEAEAARRREQLEAQVKQEAYAKGYTEGHDQGFETGMEEATRLLTQAGEFIHLAEKAVRTEFEKVEGELLTFALRVAERIVRASLTVEPQRLLDIARALVLLPQEREGMVLHISPEDAGWASELRMDSFPCPWVKDDSLKQGDCFLQCPEGIYDAQLTGQLAKLEQVLREEFKHGGLEPIGPESSGD